MLDSVSSTRAAELNIKAVGYNLKTEAQKDGVKEK